MATLLVQEELFWKQRAKAHWLHEGDRNSKYFHAMASSWKNINKMLQLKKEDGMVVEDQAGMSNIAKEYFVNLFHEDNGMHNLVTDVVSRCIIDDDNEKLIAPFFLEEFRIALSRMHPDKSPGPDGLNAAFFNRFWDLCGLDVFNACCHWLDMGYFPASVNDTTIVLVPKRD